MPTREPVPSGGKPTVASVHKQLLALQAELDKLQGEVDSNEQEDSREERRRKARSTSPGAARRKVLGLHPTMPGKLEEWEFKYDIYTGRERWMHVRHKPGGKPGQRYTDEEWEVVLEERREKRSDVHSDQSR